MQEMNEKIDELMTFLTNERTKAGPYKVEELKRFYRIVSKNSAYCFIVKEDFQNKGIGKVKAGDLLMPASWSAPAKHPRGNLFNRSSWETAFGEWGMKYLRG